MSTKDTEIRRMVLNELENEPNQTLPHLAKDYQRCVNIRQDAKDIKYVCLENNGKKKKLHLYNDCPHENIKCLRCKKKKKDIKKLSVRQK